MDRDSRCTGVGACRARCPQLGQAHAFRRSRVVGRERKKIPEVCPGYAADHRKIRSAEGGTRTPTGISPLRPERSASTSSTTSAADLEFSRFTGSKTVRFQL
jgi:hypothetical protein